MKAIPKINTDNECLSIDAKRMNTDILSVFIKRLFLIVLSLIPYNLSLIPKSVCIVFSSMLCLYLSVFIPACYIF